ncbi:PocR ligand-binding domain-containing protein [Desulfosporosinus metallidurans]|uniref:Response regulator containing CheY-like receiver domain and AraC-type DNA-binding domain n=1 Tax=Desulfosporosinus metallidurans TaxID=1888891 RepID=A0A1Q8QX75_9FIRM|nr:PocR ligand-binding domain-containing protein [Desulfosporosinus metallidurans]OLN31939.1 Response regulator containing CheY-like receiver domain and AraC-type DNA-binding domain [Desulfosporosinus metallidurans]
MSNKSIESFIDPSYLEEVLGSFSKATGLHIEAVNRKGETLAILGNKKRNDFCQFIRSNSKGEKKCLASYKEATLEAAKWNEPYFFRCHAGIVIWAVPIILDNVFLGSIICGQILLWKPDEFFLRDLKKSNAKDLDYDILQEKVKSVSICSPEQSQAAADMLFVVVNHIVKRNIHKLEEENAYRLESLKIKADLENRKKKKSNLEFTDYGTYLKKERRFLSYIRLGDKTRAENYLMILLTDLLTKTAGDIATIKIRILELASLSSRAAVEGGADAEQAMSILKDFNDEVDRIDRVEEFFVKVHKVIATFLDGIFKLADKKHLSLVTNARNFIIENYHKPITIKATADHLFISPSHLSRLFRLELDCTFNDYLTRVRVEKAVELLKKPEFSVEQVSKAVGFKSQSYFAEIFRKYIGVTPLIYKNSLF